MSQRFPKPLPSESKRPRFRPQLETLEDRTLMATPPVMETPTLAAHAIATGIAGPTGMAFLGTNEFLVTEKNTGIVQHVRNGQLLGPVLDLPVNFASERGLLSVALDPKFAANRYVYLYWTSPAAPNEDPAFPSATESADDPAKIAFGDTDDVMAVPLLGNRVDRFVWDTSGSSPTLRWDANLIKLRAFQNDGAAIPDGQGDEGQPALGNHDGGVIRFGADGMLYIIIGDVGRRGQLQNLQFGPAGDASQRGANDDQFGGPEMDAAHFTGVILRLDPADGAAPKDNPFFKAGRSLGGEIGANLQKVFAYGLRNSFGMTVDPLTGNLWYTENGDDAFDEINLAFAGHNSGWVQMMGPASRVEEFKKIELTLGQQSLQQLRWGPENIANSSPEALAALFELPGSRYSDPEFSWRYAVPPTALTFAAARSMGPLYGDLIVANGAGQLMAFEVGKDRQGLRLSGNLSDGVDDNRAKFVAMESQRLVIGQGFGIVTDLQNSPTGSIFVVSHTNGTIYEVVRRTAESFSTAGGNNQRTRSSARGMFNLQLGTDRSRMEFQLKHSAIDQVTAIHLRLGDNGSGPVIATIRLPSNGARTSGTSAAMRGSLTAADLTGSLAGQSLDDLYMELLTGQVSVSVETTGGAIGTKADMLLGQLRPRPNPAGAR